MPDKKIMNRGNSIHTYAENLTAEIFKEMADYIKEDTTDKQIIGLQIKIKRIIEREAVYTK